MSGQVFEAFTKSLGVIFASEIGDKTFFIAAIMAMRNPRTLVFVGCAGALIVMTILSTALGAVAPKLIPAVYTHWASVVLFFFFGLVALRDATKAYMSGEGGSEFEEVEEELKKSRTRKGASSWVRRMLSTVVVEAFTMTFVAEWGDRSQITTIGLAASHSALGVSLGGCLGHVTCTVAAILGGQRLASVIDEKAVNLVGGVMFILFGAFALYEGPHAAR